MAIENFATNVLRIIQKMINNAGTDERAYVYPNFNPELLDKIKKQYSLDESESILYIYDLNFFSNGSVGGAVKDLAKSFLLGGTLGLSTLVTNNNQYAVVLTDLGIYYRPNSEIKNPFYVEWDHITNIAASGNNIIITMEDGAIYQIEDVNSEISGFHRLLYASTIADYLQRILQEYHKDIDLADEFTMACEALLHKESCNEEIFTFCETHEAHLSELPEYTQSIVLKGLIKLYFKLLGQHCKAAQLIVTKIDQLCQIHLDIFHKNNAQWDYQKVNKDIFAFWGILQSHRQQIEEKYIGLQRLRKAMDCEGKFNWADERTVNQTFENLTRTVVENFMLIDPNNRHFLVIDSNMSYLASDNFMVLPKQQAQKALCFPLHHPQEHELYISHPYKDNLYIPYESCEFELFKDKMSELRLVLQTMGATKIKILDTNSQEEKKEHNDHLSAAVNISAKINKAGGELDRTSKKDEYENLYRQYQAESVFLPSRLPYIPDGLVWYPHETEWQRIFQQRLGGMLHHIVSISVASETQISQQKQTNLKADFKALIVKIEGNIAYDVDEMFSKKQSTTWQLDVTFAPLEELQDKESSPNICPEIPDSTIVDLTDDEQAYLESVREFYEDDGTIDEKERSLLDKVRNRWNISKIRASELEAMVIHPIADFDEECEYRDIVRDLIENGFGEKERKVLEKFKNKLHISDERAAQIEKEEITKLN